MELQLFSDLPQLEAISVNDLEKYGIIRVPQVVYQIMYDVVQPGMPLEHNQQRIKRVLLDWLADAYPDKVLESFEELSNVDAKNLSGKVKGITFGFYCKLLNKKDEKTNLMLPSGNPSSDELYKIDDVSGDE